MSVLRRGCSKMAVVATAALHSALLAQLGSCCLHVPSDVLWRLIFRVIQTRLFSFCKSVVIARQGQKSGE